MPGTFAYTPPAGTVLGVGSNQALTVSFAPTDTNDFTPASATVTVTVTKAAQTPIGIYATRVTATYTNFRWANDAYKTFPAE